MTTTIRVTRFASLSLVAAAALTVAACGGGGETTAVRRQLVRRPRPATRSSVHHHSPSPSQALRAPPAIEVIRRLNTSQSSPPLISTGEEQ